MMRSRKYVSISRKPKWRHVHYPLYAKWYRILFKISWEKEILEPAAVSVAHSLDFLYIITHIIKWTRAKALRLGHVYQDWMCCWRLASGVFSSSGTAETTTMNSWPCGKLLFSGIINCFKSIPNYKMQKRQSLFFTGLDSTLCMTSTDKKYCQK